MYLDMLNIFPVGSKKSYQSTLYRSAMEISIQLKFQAGWYSLDLKMFLTGSRSFLTCLFLCLVFSWKDRVRYKLYGNVFCTFIWYLWNVSKNISYFIWYLSPLDRLFNSHTLFTSGYLKETSYRDRSATCRRITTMLWHLSKIHLVIINEKTCKLLRR